MTSSRLLKATAAAGLAVAALTIGGAQAQTNSDAPLEIGADTFEGFDQQGLAIYRGNVEAVQADSRLRCSELRIEFARKGGARTDRVGGGFGDVQRYVCRGPVWYVTPREIARGDNGVYEATTSLITLTGDVVLRQGQNVAQGDRLTINTNTRESRLDANAPGSGPNRVRSVLYPESAPARPATAAQPPASRQ